MAQAVTDNQREWQISSIRRLSADGDATAADTPVRGDLWLAASASR